MTNNDRRSRVVAAVGQVAAAYFLPLFYNIEIRGEFPEGNALYLPRHRSLMDIPLLGHILCREFGDSPHVVMKSSLPKALEMIGGVSIARPKETSQKANGSGDEGLFRESIREARETNGRAAQRIGDLLIEGHSAIVFPEGTRRDQYNADLKTGMVNKIVKYVREKAGCTPRLVPIGTAYRHPTIPRDFTVVIGRQIEYDGNFISNLAQAIGDLSLRASKA